MPFVGCDPRNDEHKDGNHNVGNEDRQPKMAGKWIEKALNAHPTLRFRSGFLKKEDRGLTFKKSKKYYIYDYIYHLNTYVSRTLLPTYLFLYNIYRVHSVYWIHSYFTRYINAYFVS